MAREKRFSTAPAGGSIGRDPFDEHEHEHEDEDERDEGGKPGVLPDLFRKMMAAGFSGLFTTEAAIRAALGDSVPREWVDFVAEQSERTRAELAQRLAQEFGRVLERVDLVELAEQLLEGRTVEVKAEFRLGPRRGPAARDEGAAAARASGSEDAPRSKTR